MDIQAIINGIAEQQQGTNALIQIQVEDQYYIRIIGDSSRLSKSSRAAAVPDTRPFLSWMKEQIEQAPISENTKVSHRNAHMRLTAFRRGVTFAEIDCRFLFLASFTLVIKTNIKPVCHRTLFKCRVVGVRLDL